MPRKLRLSVHRKNEFRKRALKEQRPLLVSIPRTSLKLDYSMLKRELNSLIKLPRGWIEVAGAKIMYSKVEQSCDDEPKLSLTLVVHQDFSWHVQISGHAHHLTTTSCSLSSLPSTISSTWDVQAILYFLNTSAICKGNSDQKFAVLAAKRKGVFWNASGTNQVAIYDTTNATIRHVQCEVLLSQASSSASGDLQQCAACKNYRQTLNRLLHRFENEQSDSSKTKSNSDSHSNYRFLSSPEKNERLHQLHHQARLSQQRVRRLKECLEGVAEDRSVTVNSDLHDDLKQIMQDNTTTINKSYPPDSFAKIFWESQQQAHIKSPKAMRWDPLMIRWCIYLRHLSSSAYEMLRETNVIRLPSQRTLRDYTYFTKAAAGFSADVDQHLIETIKIQSCPERDKYVIAVMDEMHVREGLVYKKHTGEVVGYTDLGDINRHLQRFEQQLLENAHGEDLPHADSMLVILVRGLFSQLKFPYAQFPCTSLSGDQMYDPFWEAVGRLELCGLKVLALTCDGLAANRRLFKLHDVDSRVVHRVSNPYSTDGRYLYFFIDPPHLIKTVRNGWANNKRHLWCKGKKILWSHLEELYYKNRSAFTPGLALIPKLKYEHIALTSFSKMRVDLAAQALSSSVAHALKLTGGKEVEETVQFITHFDKFFDSLNVSSLSAGKLQRNPFKSPYRSAKDFRLKWLEEEFMGYLQDWEKSVRGRRECTKSEQLMMLLSAETRLGIEITVRSFVELVRYVFTIPGVTVFLSNRLCQDPLENFFGQQRQRGRASDNPNTEEFLKATQALRVINNTCSMVRGNCRGTTSSSKKRHLISLEDQSTPLPKRRYYHK